jgi:hypothetical protein
VPPDVPLPRHGSRPTDAALLPCRGRRATVAHPVNSGDRVLLYVRFVPLFLMECCHFLIYIAMIDGKAQCIGQARMGGGGFRRARRDDVVPYLWRKRRRGTYRLMSDSPHRTRKP